MAHFITQAHPSKKSSTLLFLHSHTSHLSIGVTDMATDAGITMVLFSPKCTHRMLPLDVIVFNSFKTVCPSVSKLNEIALFINGVFIAIAKQCLDEGATRKNKKSGFKFTGISWWCKLYGFRHTFQNGSTPSGGLL